MGHVASPATFPPAPQGRGPRQPLPAASPARRLAGTDLKQPESRAQRGPDTSPRSHSAVARSGATQATVPAREGARPPCGTHSRSCPRAPAPPRTLSGQRPWCATGPRAPHAGRGLPGLRCARAGWGRGDSGAEPVPRGARAASYSGGRRSGAVLALARFPRGRGGGNGGRGRTRRGYASAAAPRDELAGSATCIPPPTLRGPAAEPRRRDREGRANEPSLKAGPSPRPAPRWAPQRSARCR